MTPLLAKGRKRNGKRLVCAKDLAMFKQLSLIGRLIIIAGSQSRQRGGKTKGQGRDSGERESLSAGHRAGESEQKTERGKHAGAAYDGI